MREQLAVWWPGLRAFRSPSGATARRFEAGRLYQLAYQARDPMVSGLALAAVRDLPAFLHHAEVDDTGAANPLAGQFSSQPHLSATGPAICERDRNPLLPGPGLRALLIDLDDWISRRTRPPPSRVPRRFNRTLVPSLPQHGVGRPLAAFCHEAP